MTVPVISGTARTNRFAGRIDQAKLSRQAHPQPLRLSEIRRRWRHTHTLAAIASYRQLLTTQAPSGTTGRGFESESSIALGESNESMMQRRSR